MCLILILQTLLDDGLSYSGEEAMDAVDGVTHTIDNYREDETNNYPTVTQLNKKKDLFDEKAASTVSNTIDTATISKGLGHSDSQPVHFETTERLLANPQTTHARGNRTTNIESLEKDSYVTQTDLVSIPTESKPNSSQSTLSRKRNEDVDSTTPGIMLTLKVRIVVINCSCMSKLAV